MSILHVLIILLAFSWQNPDVNPDQTKGKTVYFWLDTWCEECSINDSTEMGKYFVCNDTILEADFDNANKIVDSFKEQLQKDFDNPQKITRSVVFRYHQTKAEAIDQKRKQIQKMKKRGYKIVEIPFEL